MMPLTQEQVQVIKSTVPILQQHGEHITRRFYKTVLEEHPDLNNVFNHANQVNSHQAKALAGALYAYAAHIDDLGVLSRALEKICHKHVSLHIQPRHYKIVGEGILRAMSAVLGVACTKEILSAWDAAYWQLAEICIERESQLYCDTNGWTGWRNFVISEKTAESDEVTSFCLKPEDGQELPTFRPGQYVSILVDVHQFGYKQSRQYSLSDASKPDHYRISVKKEPGLNAKDSRASSHPGWVSNVLHQQKTLGDVVHLSHPAGDFFHDDTKHQHGPVVLLSAGVGITPMISILNTLVEGDFKQPICFVHGARRMSTFAFREHVQRVEQNCSNVHLAVFVKNVNLEQDVQGRDFTHRGRLDLTKLSQEGDLFLSHVKATYYVCGPSTFLTDVWNGLRILGVGQDRIKLELFGTGDLPTND